MEDGGHAASITNVFPPHVPRLPVRWSTNGVAVTDGTRLFVFILSLSLRVHVRNQESGGHLFIVAQRVFFQPHACIFSNSFSACSFGGLAFPIFSLPLCFSLSPLLPFLPASAVLPSSHERPDTPWSVVFRGASCFSRCVLLDHYSHKRPRFHFARTTAGEQEQESGIRRRWKFLQRMETPSHSNPVNDCSVFN
jgi:hypothetical protein